MDDGTQETISGRTHGEACTTLPYIERKYEGTSACEAGEGPHTGPQHGKLSIRLAFNFLNSQVEDWSLKGRVEVGGGDVKEH